MAKTKESIKMTPSFDLVTALALALFVSPVEDVMKRFGLIMVNEVKQS